MGKVEKVVVLSVLFLIAVILAISLTTDNPIQKDKAAVLGETTPTPQAPVVAANVPAAEPAKTSPLLSANVQDPAATPAAAAPATPAPAAALVVPTGSILKTTDGLTKSFDDARMFYTWQAGDTYVAVANKLYGAPEKFTLLKNVNEGRDQVQPGEKILVPVFDVESASAPAPEVAAKPAKESSAKKSAAGSSKPVEKSAVSSVAGAKLHVVKDGESLWKIAKAELGNGGRWEEIYKLNRDQMKTPEALRTGMKLKLP